MVLQLSVGKFKGWMRILLYFIHLARLHQYCSHPGQGDNLRKNARNARSEGRAETQSNNKMYWKIRLMVVAPHYLCFLLVYLHSDWITEYVFYDWRVFIPNSVYKQAGNNIWQSW